MIIILLVLIAKIIEIGIEIVYLNRCIDRTRKFSVTAVILTIYTFPSILCWVIQAWKAIKHEVFNIRK